MKPNDLYSHFNKGLLELRETFHRTGRLDDSNTKLDEIVKLLALELTSLREPDKHSQSLSDILIQYRFGKIPSLIGTLNKMLKKAAQSALFANADGESLLGVNPALSFLL